MVVDSARGKSSNHCCLPRRWLRRALRHAYTLLLNAGESLRILVLDLSPDCADMCCCAAAADCVSDSVVTTLCVSPSTAPEFTVPNTRTVAVRYGMVFVCVCMHVCAYVCTCACRFLIFCFVCLVACSCSGHRHF